LARELNKKVLFDIDDLVIDKKYTKLIPFLKTLKPKEKKIYDDGVNKMRRTLLHCDAAITTTKALATELKNYVPEVFINHNVASEEMWVLSENALINYDNDMKFIRKMRKEKLHTISVDLTVKMRNQFNFVKNPEKQRKIRIENALENKYIDDDADNENKKRNKSHKRKFISFIDSKLINNLMKHFTGKVKNEISTQLINREIKF